MDSLLALNVPIKSEKCEKDVGKIFLFAHLLARNLSVNYNFTKMHCFIIVLFFFFSVYGIGALCPFNCQCHRTQSICVLSNCEDPLFVETLELRVFGFLCTTHYMELMKYPAMKKILLSSSCLEYLTNCK